MQQQKDPSSFTTHPPAVLKAQIKAMLCHCKIKQQSLENLPMVLLQFLQERGLDKHELSVKIPRYIRTKPSITITTAELSASLNISEQEIVQLQSFFWAINPETKINRCPLYEAGELYGMDYSSSIPGKCLEVDQKDRVLELCCAPGNKSMLIADHHPGVKIVGVEINVNRGNVMKSLVKKYRLEGQIEVVAADGLTYDDAAPFDRVLIDAECTHEGSLKHIHKFFKEQEKPQEEPLLKMDQKHSKQQQKQFKINNSNPYTSQITSANKWTKSDFEERFLDKFKLSQLKTLQYGLLQNGFRLLRDGGIAVYSTCSFDWQQNQDIVEQFLGKQKNAELVDAGKDLQCAVEWSKGRLKGTIRLKPSISYCGGMFIAKIRKLPIPSKKTDS